MTQFHIPLAATALISLAACSGPAGDIASMGLEQMAQAGVSEMMATAMANDAAAAPAPTTQAEAEAQTEAATASMGGMSGMQATVMARVGTAAFDRACLQTLPDFSGVEDALTEMDFIRSGDAWVLEEGAQTVAVRLGTFNGSRACFVDIYNTTKTLVVTELNLFLDMRFGVTGLDSSEAVTTTSVNAASGPATISIARQNSGPSVVLSAY